MKPRQLLVWAVSCIAPGILAQEVPGITNVGLAATQLEVFGNRVLFSVYEPEQGVDLNGDGDRGDWVPHVYDLDSGTTRSLEVAGSWVAQSGDGLVLLASERDQREDLNGDGDMRDGVLQVVSLESWAKRNTGFATESRPSLSGTRLAFGIREESQGEDLNDDGDLEDLVVAVHEIDSGATRHLGLAMTWETPTVVGRWVVFAVDEFSQGDDVNGDGSARGRVLHVYDFESGNVTNLGFDGGVFHNFGHRVLIQSGGWWLYDLEAAEPLSLGVCGEFLSASDDRVTLGVDEQALGADLNSDGDLVDRRILHVVDLGAATTANLRIAVHVALFQGLVLGAPAFVANGVVFRGDETAQNADLNDDGDMEDTVLHVYDQRSGETRSLGLAVSLQGLWTSGDRIAFLVDESSDIGDTNEDGDDEDEVLHVYDLATGQTESLPLASGSIGADFVGRWLVFTVREFEQSEDLNDDGDQEDRVPHVHDAASGEIRPLRLDGDALSMTEDWVALQVYDAPNDIGLNLDPDRDGVRDASVLYLHEPRSGRTTNLSLVPHIPSGVSFSRDWAVFTVQEYHQGIDLNGDGDMEERVLHVVHLDELEVSIGEFRRADANADGRVDLADASFTLNYLFVSGPRPSCVAAVNTNGDGLIDLADPVHLLNHLFLGGPAPPAPFPDCGPSELAIDQELGCQTPPMKCE